MSNPICATINYQEATIATGLGRDYSHDEVAALLDQHSSRFKDQLELVRSKPFGLEELMN